MLMNKDGLIKEKEHILNQQVLCSQEQAIELKMTVKLDDGVF